MFFSVQTKLSERSPRSNDQRVLNHPRTRSKQEFNKHATNANR
jgi:hypothetical protein